MLVDIELISVRARRMDFQVINIISLVFMRQESSPPSPLLCHCASLLCQSTVLLLGVIPISQPDLEPLPSCCVLLIYLSFVIHINLHILDFLLAFFSFHALDKAIEQNIPVFHISFLFWSQPSKYRPMISTKLNIQSLSYSLWLFLFFYIPQWIEDYLYDRLPSNIIEKSEPFFTSTVASNRFP